MNLVSKRKSQEMKRRKEKTKTKTRNVIIRDVRTVKLNAILEKKKPLQLNWPDLNVKLTAEKKMRPKLKKERGNKNC